MKSKIARRLTLYFSVVLLLFSVIIGLIFIALFRNQTLSQHRKDMESRALIIADLFSEYLGAQASGMTGKGMMGSGQGGMRAYLRFVDDIAMTDVWIVDESLNLITSSGPTSGIEYNYADLPTDADKVVSTVFQGATTFSEGFSGLLKEPTLTVGTPIMLHGQIVGAVLLHAPVQGITDATMQGIWILVASLFIALLLSVSASVLLALSFTKPLRQMEISALLLAEGDYSVKTGVQQADEIGALAKSIDILSDKLAAAKQESQKLEQLRRDFIANISHELKTPVTVLRGSLEALCEGVVTEPEQVKNYHQQMLLESMSLQRLINDLLDLSKLQNADFMLEMQECNLCEILLDAVRSARQLATQKSINVQLAMDLPVFPFVGDYGRLRQMLLIVLDNAIKFSPTGGIVRVSLEQSAVTIRDQGNGIVVEDLPHIFDRFYKVESEGNKNGSGLGLAIAKQIADRHGIAITVDSHPRSGTTFCFQF